MPTIIIILNEIHLFPWVESPPSAYLVQGLFLAEQLVDSHVFDENRRAEGGKRRTAPTCDHGSSRRSRSGGYKTSWKVSISVGDDEENNKTSYICMMMRSYRTRRTSCFRR